MHSDLYTQIQAIAKGDQHAHLLLSAPAALYQNNFSHSLKKFSGFGDFESNVRSNYIPTLNSCKKRLEVIDAAFAIWVKEGVSLVESSIDIMTIVACVEEWQEFKERLTQLIAQYSEQLDIRLELGLARENKFDLTNLISTELNSGFFKGVDLYGNEQANSLESFSWFFNKARDTGCYVKLHCGEQSDSQQMKTDLKKVKPDAIQHGISANMDQKLLDHLARHQIKLNLAPASNIALGLFADYQEYPIRKFLDSGVKITISSDDFAVFGQSVTQQLVEFMQLEVITEDQLELLCNNSLEPTKII